MSELNEIKARAAEVEKVMLKARSDRAWTGKWFDSFVVNIKADLDRAVAIAETRFIIPREAVLTSLDRVIAERDEARRQLDAAIEERDLALDVQGALFQQDLDEARAAVLTLRDAADDMFKHCDVGIGAMKLRDALADTESYEQYR